MSTARPAAMQQSLVISLIIFVTLTFILLIVTYFAFSQSEKQRLAAEESKAAAETASRELIAAKQGLETLRGLIGVGEEEPDSSKIKENVEAQIAKAYPEFQEEPKTLLNLAMSLKKIREDKESQLEVSQAADKRSQADRQKAEDEKVQAVKEKDDGKAQSDQKVADLTKANENAASDFKQTTDRLGQERDEAAKNSAAMTLLLDEIKKGEKEVGEKAFEKLDPVEQVRALITLIRKQQGQIDVLQEIEILRMVAGQDTRIQTYVLQALGATAKEVAQIEPLLRSGPRPSSQGIDGRVVAVDPGGRTVIVESGFTFDVRPGLILQVFGGLGTGSGSPSTLPVKLSPKGTIEVVSLEGGSRLLCRIREESLTSLIGEGDYVASPLWDGGKKLNAVIVGWVDLDGDAEEDSKELVGMIERAGGSVGDAVTDDTTLLVDASAMLGDEGEANSRRKLSPAMKTRRDLQLKNARRLNVPLIRVDEIRYWLGDLPRPPADGASSFAAPVPPPEPAAR